MVIDGDHPVCVSSCICICVCYHLISETTVNKILLYRQTIDG